MPNNKQIKYKINDRGCWFCTSHASSSNGGHPCKTINKKIIRISNIMYEEKYKEKIPDGMTTYNTCGTPMCINPEHLKIGIIGENNWNIAKSIKYIVNENKCWLCISHKTNNRGYPKMGRGLISHIMYEKYKGTIPKGICVLHTCDVRLCINPDHLWLGTIIDNNADRHKKGRDFITQGELNGKAKLKEKDIIEIRSSNKSIKELSIEFNVGMPAIYKIINKINWKHI